MTLYHTLFRTTVNYLQLPFCHMNTIYHPSPVNKQTSVATPIPLQANTLPDFICSQMLSTLYHMAPHTHLLCMMYLSEPHPLHVPFVCAGDYFMVSTVSPKGEAHLLVYQLKLSSASHEYSAGLNKTLKKFTSKPITQVGVAGGKA